MTKLYIYSDLVSRYGISFFKYQCNIHNIKVKTRKACFEKQVFKGINTSVIINYINLDAILGMFISRLQSIFEFIVGLFITFSQEQKVVIVEQYFTSRSYARIFKDFRVNI